MSKLPSFQFYPGDWLREASLRACSLAARGLWTDMLCWMHDSPVRGRLLKSTGVAFADTELSRMAGCTVPQLRKLLAELETSGALSRDENGVIYSRRMVNDEVARARAAENGKLGGNPNLKRGSDVGSPSPEGEANQGHKAGVNGGDKAGVASGGSLKPTPSSSSSSSSSSSTSSSVNTGSASADGGSNSDGEKNSSEPKAKPPTAKENTDAASEVPIPPQLDTPEFRTVWATWIKDRYDRRKAMTPIAAKAQLDKLVKIGPAKAIDCINESLANGWAGLFPEREHPAAKPPPPATETMGEKMRRLASEMNLRPKGE